jgi:hypothetical protein
MRWHLSGSNRCVDRAKPALRRTAAADRFHDFRQHCDCHPDIVFNAPTMIGDDDCIDIRIGGDLGIGMEGATA